MNMKFRLRKSLRQLIYRFKKLALKYHPMKNSQQMRMYEPKFQLICEAFEVLSSHQLKTIYEQYGSDVLRQGFKGPDGSK
jgi:DnaJ-class molecular chaperone